MSDAEQWIEHLQLKPHPEGGFFRETYRASESITQADLPERFGGDRAFSTAIYFLLRSGDFSALHRIKSDEVWHFYAGSTLTIHVINSQDEHTPIRLGTDIAAHAVPQAVVAAGDLFGARVEDPNTFALVGCTVAPGFDFADFLMPSRGELLQQYPRHRDVIERLTRE